MVCVCGIVTFYIQVKFGWGDPFWICRVATKECSLSNLAVWSLVVTQSP